MSIVALRRFDHDPGARLDYEIDWSDMLVAGEAIASSTWTVPSSVEKLSDGKTGTAARIRIGTTPAGWHALTNRITTNASPSRTDERTILLRAVNR